MGKALGSNQNKNADGSIDDSTRTWQNKLLGGFSNDKALPGTIAQIGQPQGGGAARPAPAQQFQAPQAQQFQAPDTSYLQRRPNSNAFFGG